MLVDIRVHSTSAALHWKPGGGSAATVQGTEVSRSLSALGSASAHVTAEP